MTIFDQSSTPPDNWPKKGDKLFASGDDWWHNACLNYSNDNWELYINGYKKAGDVLSDYINETQLHQDFLVFPIVFVYRQYIELHLKKLIIDIKKLQKIEYGYPKTHDLNIIWAECRGLIKKLEPKASTCDLEAIDESIQQFCVIDPSSESFRYPTKISGEYSLPLDLRYINIRNLAEVMENLSCFFDAVDTMVSVFIDYQQEMDSYYPEY
jgi:hypothetical protein